MRTLVETLKQNDQDFEWYPTTDEIIAAAIKDLKELQQDRYYWNSEDGSILDIGAGNGKVLNIFREKLNIHNLYAIEKSAILCQQLDSDILIVGTNFEEQSLISKPVDIVFCNPPYSQFKEWVTKVIKESQANIAYLVIPERWVESSEILDAADFRDAKLGIVGEFDFLNAERGARAKVHIVRVLFRQNKDDAFNRFFDETFSSIKDKFEFAEKEQPEKHPGVSELVISPNYPQALVNLYQQEMTNVQKNYSLVGDLDVDLLKEFDINPDKIRKCLKTRLAGLRNDYWHELFSHLKTVTDRLTSKSRSRLLETLHKQVHVDFTVSNICAIMIWVVKNANHYMESQFIETYERLVDKCNVKMYKSNKRAWVDDYWRYGEGEKNSHYALDYRIVSHQIGGVDTSSYSWEKGLHKSAAEFLGDLLTLASNLGFRCDTVPSLLNTERDKWMPGKAQDFFYDDPPSILFEAKGFKNGNMHIRFAKEFILALNVEFGRLKGWLKNSSEATIELQTPEAAEYFRSHIQIGNKNITLLLT